MLNAYTDHILSVDIYLFKGFIKFLLCITGFYFISCKPVIKISRIKWLKQMSTVFNFN